MSASNIFPGFLKIALDGDNVFAEFERKAAAAADSVERHFKGSLDEVARITQRALSQPLNASGALDLGVPEMRQAAAAAEQRAQALRHVADAANAVAQREATLTASQQTHTAAANAAAFAAEREALTARERVATYETLQRELDETAMATTRLTGATTTALRVQANTGASIGAQRAGYQQLSYQIGDVSQQLSLGVNPAIVFGQQFGQIAQALQLATGASRGFIGFIAGPWGAVLTGVITATALWATRTNEAASATATAKTGAEALSTAQSALAEMFDLSTGRIVRNTEALRLNVIMQAEQLRAQAIAQRQAGLRTLRDAGEYSWASTFRNIAGATIGVHGLQGGDPTAAAQSGAVTELLRRFEVARRMPRGQARSRELDRLVIALSRVPSDRLSQSGRDLAQALADIGNADEVEGTAGDMLRSVLSGRLASSLARPGTNRSRGGGGDAAGRLAEFAEDAERRIANITGRFAETPPAVEAVRRAMGELDDIASDIERRRPPNYEELVTQLNAARTTVEQGLDGPLREWTAEQERQRQIQALINSGRETEAEILQATFALQKQQGTLGDEALATVRETIQARHEEARAAEEERRRQQAYLQSIDQLRTSLESTIANLGTRGLRGIGDVASTLFGQFRQLSAANIVERLFGGTFRELEDYVSGRGRVIESNQAMATAADEVTTSFEGLKDAIEGATDALAGGVGTGGSKSIDGAVKGMADSLKQAADDVGEEIVVTGQRRKGGAPALADLSPRDFSIRAITGLLGPLGLDERLTRRISAGVADAMQGAFVGQSAASILLGGRGSSTGAALGGILGQEAGKALGRTIGKEAGGLLGTLGSAAGPIGSIVGGIAGSLLGGLLTSTPRASSTIGAGANGELAITGTAGTSSLRGRSIEAADSVIANVSRIAELFGASVDASRGSVSIGMRKDTYRVDPTGQGRTKLSKGAVEYQDAESAVRAAVLDLIRDGVITGLRAGTQRLLQAAKDLDSGVQKALDFEQVFKDLKARLDPVGAAIDGVNLKFDRLRKIFAEAGASAADLADLEKLYGLERADAIKQASEAMTSSLKGLIDDLTVNNDARSLRERLSLARAAYDPLAARVAAGDQTVDFDEFSEAARTVEQLARQIYGSGEDYFATADSILALAQTAMDRQNSIIAMATGSDGSTTGPDSHDTNVPVVSAVDRLGDRLVTELAARLDVANDNQATMVRLLASLDLSSASGRANKLYGF